MLHPKTSPNWATVEDLKVGDAVVADSGFTCLAAGMRVIVHDDDGNLFVPCAEGRHYIEGQLENGRYVGFTKSVGDGAPRFSPGQAEEGSPC